MAGRAPCHRLQDGAAVHPNGHASPDRGLDPGHTGRIGGRLPQQQDRGRGNPTPAQRARPGRGDRPGQRDAGFRWRWPQRLRLHPDRQRQHPGLHHHQRRQLQQRLGRQLAARGGRWRWRMDGGVADPVAHRADEEGHWRQAHRRDLPGPGGRQRRGAHGLAGGHVRTPAVPQPVREDRDPGLLAVAARGDALRGGPARPGLPRQPVRCRRRHLLEAEQPVPADRHDQPGLRPGRERFAGGQLRRAGNLLQRQAPVLHREPGFLRFRPAVRQQPVALHAAHRRGIGRLLRAGRDLQRPGRHHRRDQVQRQHRRDPVRCVPGRRGRRWRPPLQRAAPAACVRRGRGRQ